MTTTATAAPSATGEPVPPATTAAPDVYLTISVPHVTGDYDVNDPGAPGLEWSSTGAGAVFVCGPGFASLAGAGHGVPCPGLLDGDTCRVAPGVYPYRLDASGTDGPPASRTVTLTVGPA